MRQAVRAHTLDGDLTDRAAHQLLDSSMFLSNWANTSTASRPRA